MICNNVKKIYKLSLILAFFMVLTTPLFSQTKAVDPSIVITMSKLQSIVDKAVAEAKAEVIKSYELKIIDIRKEYEITLAKRDAAYAKLNIDLTAESIKYKNEHISFGNYKKNLIKYFVIDSVVSSLGTLVIEHLVIKK
jgi:2,3-bisphosphoglycerate-independent phosphoglycerate mutase